MRRWIAVSVGVLTTVLVLVGGVASAPFADTVRLADARIAIPGVAQTPPMGWNSWNAYGCAVSFLGSRIGAVVSCASSA